MDFGAVYPHLLQGRTVRREGWPDGLRLKMAPTTETEAAHPVIVYTDGRKDHAYQHPVMDLYHSRDWVLADLPEPRDEEMPP